MLAMVLEYYIEYTNLLGIVYDRHLRICMNGYCVVNIGK